MWQSVNVCNDRDYQELKKNYQFVMPPPPSSSSRSTDERPKTTWQQRMAKAYHDRLFKEYAIADLSRCKDGGGVGLRWRMEREVVDGRGHFTCGNKHCPATRTIMEMSPANESYLSEYYKTDRRCCDEDEKRHVSKIPHGLGLHSYEVNLIQANELVELSKRILRIKIIATWFMMKTRPLTRKNVYCRNSDPSGVVGKDCII